MPLTLIRAKKWLLHSFVIVSLYRKRMTLGMRIKIRDRIAQESAKALALVEYLRVEFSIYVAFQPVDIMHEPILYPQGRSEGIGL